MRCALHDLAAGPDGSCVRCRREASEAAQADVAAERAARQRLVLMGFVAFVVLSPIAVAGVRWWEAPRGAVVTQANAAGSVVTVASAAPLATLEPANFTADPTATTGSNASSPLDRAEHAAAITMYCRPSPSCDNQRAWLLQRGFIYKERNVDADPGAASVWRRVSPDGTVPVFDIDGQTFAGADFERLERALSYAGARRLQR